MKTEGREFELKLTVPDGSAEILASHTALAVGPGYRRQETTTYFDTADYRLHGSGITLLVRRNGGHRVQTVKLADEAGVAADRGEWEWPIDQTGPDLTLLRETPIVERLHLSSRLRKVLTTKIDRISHVLKLEGGTIVETSLDEGTIIAGAARESVRELELELLSGSPAPLYRLAMQLHAAAPLQVAFESKADRGYRLRRGGAAEARKAEDITLDRQQRGANAFRMIVLGGVGHLLSNKRGAQTGDPSAIHQLRVAVRRLRAALVLFKPHLDPRAMRQFMLELRRVGKIFGAARDWDVFCLEVLPAHLGPPGAASWRELLQVRAQERRDQAHADLKSELDAPAFTSLALGLAAWVEAGCDERSVLGDAAFTQPIAVTAPKLLDRLARNVDRRGRRIAELSDEQRHALRKSLKKLRYGIEFLGSIYSDKHVRAFLDICKAVQQDLGAINDAVAASALADKLTDGLHAGLAPAVSLLARQLADTKEKALDRLRHGWKKFHAQPWFWA